jgi:hydroxyacylglutathione hydrolase
MSTLDVYQFNCRSDNFGLLVHDPEIGVTASIDAPDADAINAALDEKGWTLSHILLTHHHYDHVDGNEALKKKWGAIVVGNEADSARLPGLDVAVRCGDTYDFGRHKAAFIDTPGHTIGHVAIYFAKAGLLFTGDTMFALGCGRLFEGRAEQMWESLSTLGDLPEETVVYCGHEYTKANAAFALTVDPDNKVLQDRAREIDRLRADGKPTLPTTIGAEKAMNPFLRAKDDKIRALLGMENADDVAVFAEIRSRKDSF